MLRSIRQAVFLDEVIDVINNVSKYEPDSLLLQFAKEEINRLNTITIWEMEDKDVE